MDAAVGCREHKQTAEDEIMPWKRSYLKDVSQFNRTDAITSFDRLIARSIPVMNMGRKSLQSSDRPAARRKTQLGLSPRTPRGGKWGPCRLPPRTPRTAPKHVSTSMIMWQGPRRRGTCDVQSLLGLTPQTGSYFNLTSMKLSVASDFPDIRVLLPPPAIVLYYHSVS